MSPTPTPPVQYQSPRRLVWGSTLRPSSNFEELGCRENYFEAHLGGSCVHCDLPVRLHACSPPRLTASQLARSSVLNRLIAPTGLSPALRRASRAHRSYSPDPNGTLKGWSPRQKLLLQEMYGCLITTRERRQRLRRMRAP